MKLRISKQAHEILILNVIFVLVGIKDAYLIDCCCLSASEVGAFLTALCAGLRISANEHFLVTVVDMDVFILNKLMWRRKLDCWRSGNASNVTVVDLHQRQPAIANEQSMAAIAMALQVFAADHLACNTSGMAVQEISRDSSLYAALGGPGLAGLLLGYPCIYHIVATKERGWADAYAHASSLLSFRGLHKISVTASLQTAGEGLASIGIHANQLEGVCLEFTLPSALVEAGIVLMADVTRALDRERRLALVDEALLALPSLQGAVIKYSIRTECFSSQTVVL